MEFVTDRFEPVECNESVEATGITHRSENYFTDKNGCRTNGIMLWDVVQQTAVKILKNSSEGRVDDLLCMRATLRIPFRGI